MTGIGKVGLGVDVLTAAQRRIARIFDDFPRVYVSFSAGKDSGVLTHLVADEARRRGRRFGLLFIDLEAQYALTIAHAMEMFAEYREIVEPFWIALPLNLRNAVSQYEPQWTCWDPLRRTDWVREPPAMAITEPAYFPWFRHAMEFEELVIDFGRWYSNRNGREETTACLVGIRAAESLNRYRTLIADKTMHAGLPWTTWKGGALYNAYPIYDWATEDVWAYYGKHGKCYNRLYDLMHRAGLSLHQQRICQPYGDDQRKGLWLFHLIEPETWSRVVARVNGANSGALYARESGNILGRIRITRPEGHTWKSFALMLLETMPAPTAEHYRDKISGFLKWWHDRGYPQGIPDEGDPAAEAAKEMPSWRRICKVLLRNDYWCKGLSFSQHKSHAFARYQTVMRNRRKAWAQILPW